MQSWNQWQLPAAPTVTAPMPQPPVGYPAAQGADPMAVMQSFMQYYNQPAPNGYTAEQWSAAQQQNWAQWQTWQQQYQQWQAQYGEKYQETMKQMQGLPNLGQLPSTTTLATSAQPPPLPKEDTSAKPPLPPEGSAFGYSGIPPPHQNNLPLFPSNKSSSNPPLPPGQPPLPPDSSRNNSSLDNASLSGKRTANSTLESVSAKKLKVDDEELTEAEKTFDAQFKQWEEQFNKWKQQNANHPDKTQYKQYEAKWTSWREKLIERREQMRRKREQQKQAAAKAEAEKDKSMVGDAKILNLLTNTENQGLINNLLGIGKTLGLTGKNEATSQEEQSQAAPNQPNVTSGQPLAMPPNITSAAWAAQQWAAQYNAGTNMMNYAPSFQQPPGLPQIATNPLAATMPMPNFNQPPNFSQQPTTNFNQPPPGLMGMTQNFSNMPPNMSSGGPNFSQPPPGFGSSSQRQQQQQGDTASGHRSGNAQDQEARQSRGEGDQRQSSMPGGPCNDSTGGGNDRFNYGANRFSGPPPNNLGGMMPSGGGGDGGNKSFGTGNQMASGGSNNRQDNCGRSSNDYRSGDRFSSSFEKDQSGNRFSRDGENHQGFGDNRITSDRDSFNPDRFGTNSDDRFNMRNDRFRQNNDNFGSNNDRFASNHDQFNSESDQFRSRNDQFSGMSGDRFGSSGDRPGMSNASSINDKFNRTSDRFDSRESSRDSGSSNFRNFGKGNQYAPAPDMPPELQKLMEKRRAAMDVFKPSNFSSLLDSTKSSSASTSLSESFRKLTGDSPFLTKTSASSFGKDTNVGPRGGPMFGTCASDISSFESSRDNRSANNPVSKFRGPGGDFAPRGQADYRSRGNEFGPRDSGDFNSRDLRDFGPLERESASQMPDGPDGGARNSGNFDLRQGNKFGQRFDRDFDEQNMQQRENFGVSNKQSTGTENFEETRKPSGQGAPMKSTDERKEESDSKENNCQSDSMRTNDDPNRKAVPPLQVPSWIETDFANDDFNETLGDKSVEEAANASSKEPSNEDCQRPPNTDASSRAASEDSKDRTTATDKKTDDLPFMGENDPKPEDLNMEPPPELPNLGPPVKDSDPKWESDERANTHEPFDRQHGDGGPRRINYDTPFGPGEMQNQSRDSGSSYGPRDMGGADPAESMRRPGPFGSHCFSDGPRGPEPLRGPFGPRGSGPEFGPRGPGDFGPFGPFGPRGPPDFRPRNPNDRSFGPRGMMPPFGPCGPMDRPFGPGESNDPSSPGNHSSFRSNTFGPRGNSDNPGIPSLMSFKFDKPMNPPVEMSAHQSNEPEMNRWGDLPPAFREPGEEPREEGSTKDRMAAPAPNVPRGPNWREAFDRNQFGDSDQRSGGPNFSEAPAPPRPANRIPMDRDRGSTGPGNQGPFVPDPATLNKDKNPKPVDLMSRPSGGPPFEEPFRGPLNDNARPGGSNYTSRRPNEGRRNEGPKEFCVEKQFNYNHGTGVPDEMTKEHLTGNVIDYGHAPRVIVHDYVTPSQCFDYDHGRLKPVVPDHEIYCKRDFRNWIENEQNLREYTDRMRVYESDLRALKRGFDQRNTHFDAHPQFRERDRMQDDRRSFERERRPPINRNDRLRRDREADDHREREHKGLKRESRERGRNERDREWERTSNKQRDDKTQHRRSRSKDRTRDRAEKIRKDTNKENKKDDERSKGNVADSESSAKKPDESTFPENSVEPKAEDDEPVVLEQVAEEPQIVEAPQAPQAATDPPATMELPKTPNFTMVDDLLCPPGRQNRPPKIVVILRGPPGSGKSFVAKLIKDKEVEQGGSAPRILSLDDYFLTEKEIETEDSNGKKTTTKDMVYEYEEAMEPSYITSLVKAFKKNITDGFFNFIILDSINEKISDYEEMWSFAKTKGFRVYVCEMEMDVQICLKRNIHSRTEDEINRIVDYFEPTPGHHQKLDVTSMLQEEAIEEVHMEDTQNVQPEATPGNDDSQDSQEDPQASAGVSKWERMEAEDKLDRLDGLAKRKNEGKPQTMEDFLQVADYYNVEDTSGKRRVRWADLEERKEQEKMRAVGFVVGQTNWDRMMDPTNGSSALTRTKYI